MVKNQKDTGLWGANLLALAPSAKDGIKDIGTLAQHRRLMQLGYPKTGRPFKLSERIFFRLLSRDDDPALLFENSKFLKEGPAAVEAIREQYREAATAALAEIGYQEDPGSGARPIRWLRTSLSSCEARWPTSRLSNQPAR